MNILILCTGNSARSILGEALFNARSGGGVTAYSAGSSPKGAPHPGAIAVLERHDLSTKGLRSKSWLEFEADGAPVMDAVITVCDNAAAEPCPVWPGAPARAHWGLSDPAGAQGEPAIRAAFDAAFEALDARVRFALEAGLVKADPAKRSAILQRAHDEAAP
ncbi:arsenate reductase ArsC [Maricaulaceae bacterium MS644]